MVTELAERVARFSAPPLLLRRYTEKLTCSEEQAEDAFEQTKRFLAVCAANRDETLASSAALDEMWHEFILFTPQYRAFCDEALGTFVDHQPASMDSAGPYLRARELAHAMFGPLSERFWPLTPDGTGATALCFAGPRPPAAQPTS